MIRRKKKPSAPIRRARTAHSRQRQHLIEACISALHLYGPSRTTVEKVVAIAKMSPGIVRFYFDSKAAMMVASLQFLATEFEERLLVPVSRLKDNPVAALELMAELYLSPELASARKVSVWYSFWGEASSRQEYYDICGQKDDRFAALVRDLIGRMIVDTAQPQLDPDGIALGLIGVLEMLWQGFAFQTEIAIDRAQAKHRCMTYLCSLFPGRFPSVPADRAAQAPSAPSGTGLPRWSYDNARMHALELDALYRGSWQLCGHRAQVAAAGAYLAADLGSERVLIVRDVNGVLRALRDCCPARPHRLVERAVGRFDGGIACRVHGLHFDLDGAAAAGASLQTFELELAGDLIFVRAGRGKTAAPSIDPWIGAVEAGAIAPLATAESVDVAADWKVVAEQWLELAMPECAPGAANPMWTAVDLIEAENPARIAWSACLAPQNRCWTAARYRTLVGKTSGSPWRRVFLPPNQLAELRPDGATILQVIPLTAGRSRMLRYAFASAAGAAGTRATSYLADRLSPRFGRGATDLFESIQQGVVTFGYQAAADAAPARAAEAFRRWIKVRIPALKNPHAPRDPA